MVVLIYSPIELYYIRLKRIFHKMENENTPGKPTQQNEQSPHSSINITKETIEYLKETGKWSKFLSILGFSLIGIMVIFAFFAGSVFAIFEDHYGTNIGTPGLIITLIYLILGAFYFIPIYYLFNFANHIKHALNEQDSYKLNEAFKNLKSHYKFIGISTIVALAIYIFIGIAMLIFGVIIGTAI